jgi:hypothetical protein
MSEMRVFSIFGTAFVTGVKSFNIDTETISEVTKNNLDNLNSYSHLSCDIDKVFNDLKASIPNLKKKQSLIVFDSLQTLRKD